MESILYNNATVFFIVLLSIAFLGGIILLFVKAYRGATLQFEPKANPKLHKEYATKDELKKVEDGLDKLSGEVKAGFCEVRDASSGSREKIYNAIRSLEKETAVLSKSEELTNRRLTEMNHKIDILIERDSK